MRPVRRGVKVILLCAIAVGFVFGALWIRRSKTHASAPEMSAPDQALLVKARPYFAESVAVPLEWQHPAAFDESYVALARQLTAEYQKFVPPDPVRPPLMPPARRPVFNEHPYNTMVRSWIERLDRGEALEPDEMVSATEALKRNQSLTRLTVQMAQHPGRDLTLAFAEEPYVVLCDPGT